MSGTTDRITLRLGFGNEALQPDDALHKKGKWMWPAEAARSVAACLQIEVEAAKEIIRFWAALGKISSQVSQHVGPVPKEIAEFREDVGSDIRLPGIFWTTETAKDFSSSLWGGGAAEVAWIDGITRFAVIGVVFNTLSIDWQLSMPIIVNEEFSNCSITKKTDAIPPKARRGPREKYDRQAFIRHAVARMEYHGGFMVGDWVAANLESEMSLWCQVTWGENQTPGRTWIKGRIAQAEAIYNDKSAANSANFGY